MFQTLEVKLVAGSANFFMPTSSRFQNIFTSCCFIMHCTARVVSRKYLLFGYKYSRQKLYTLGFFGLQAMHQRGQECGRSILGACDQRHSGCMWFVFTALWKECWWWWLHLCWSFPFVGKWNSSNHWFCQIFTQASEPTQRSHQDSCHSWVHWVNQASYRFIHQR